MSSSVAIKIGKNLAHINVDDLTPLQGTLKTLDPKAEAKLRRSLLKDGFKLSLHVWQNGGVNYLIDGHQRVHVLQNLKRQGHAVPAIPCVLVEADTYSEAKKTVLLAVSQYGKLDKYGFQDFVEGENFEFDDFDFPDIPADFFDDNISPSEIDPDDAFGKLAEGDRDSEKDTSQITLTYTLDDKTEFDSLLEHVKKSINEKNNAVALLYVLRSWVEDE